MNEAVEDGHRIVKQETKLENTNTTDGQFPCDRDHNHRNHSG